MAARKVFGRVVKEFKNPEPRCVACINIGSRDHGPDEKCVAEEWSKRLYAEKQERRKRAGDSSKGGS